MSTISDTIKQLEVQRARAEQEVAALNAAISSLKALGAGAAPKVVPAVSMAKPAKKTGISAAGRARIIAAQKARWARIKAGKPAAKPAAKPVKAAAKVTAKPAKKKVKISAEGRAKIIAAQKARWAKIRAAKAAPAAS